MAESNVIADEIRPFLLVRADAAGAASCAVWQLRGGPQSLCLFLDETAAAAYRDANLGPGWRAIRPGRDGLLDLLRAGHEAGIEFAVLDPGADSARRLFRIPAILAAATET